MFTFKRKYFAAGAALFISTGAIAATNTINNLPDEGVVTLTGTVDSVQNERKFTLLDNTGKIDVEMKSTQSVVLEKGAQVTVTGEVDKGFFSTDIDAQNVTVHKSIASAVGDAIEATTPISLDGATATTISALPDNGIVKISGIVTDVDNEQRFTLKDNTGSINIDVQSGEKVVITKGAEVTVIGSVDNGIMGKDINATKVLIVASVGR